MRRRRLAARRDLEHQALVVADDVEQHQLVAGQRPLRTPEVHGRRIGGRGGAPEAAGVLDLLVDVLELCRGGLPLPQQFLDLAGPLLAGRAGLAIELLERTAELRELRLHLGLAFLEPGALAGLDAAAQVDASGRELVQERTAAGTLGVLERGVEPPRLQLPAHHAVVVVDELREVPGSRVLAAAGLGAQRLDDVQGASEVGARPRETSRAALQPGPVRIRLRLGERRRGRRVEDGDRAVEQRPRLRPRLERFRKRAQRDRHVGVTRPEPAFLDRKGPPQRRLRFRPAAGAREDEAPALLGVGDVQVVRPEQPHAHGQRFLVEPEGVGVAPLLGVELAELVEVRGEAGVLVPQHAARRLDRLPVEALGLRVVALEALDLRQVVVEAHELGGIRPFGSLQDLARLTQAPLRLGVAVGVPVEAAQVDEERDQLGSGRPRRLLGQAHGPFEQRRRRPITVLRPQVVREVAQRQGEGERLLRPRALERRHHFPLQRLGVAKAPLVEHAEREVAAGVRDARIAIAEGREGYGQAAAVELFGPLPTPGDEVQLGELPQGRKQLERGATRGLLQLQ